MNILIDPNISYLILVGGFLLAILAMFSPGTGVMEIGAVVAILFAGYFVATLPVNWWALVILIVGVFPFLIAVRKSKNLIFLVVSIAAFIVGSVFLFRRENGGPAVDPILAVIVSILVIGLMWIVATKGIEAIRLKPLNNMDQVLGQIGTARSNIFEIGTVYINNEEWTARSAVQIPAGTKVKVISRSGFILEVEPTENDSETRDLLRE